MVGHSSVVGVRSLALVLVASGASVTAFGASFADAAAPLAVPALATAGALTDDEPTVAQAEAALSQRYAALWARLGAAERTALAERERQWLAHGRWEEKDACVAARGAQAGSACLAEVTLRHALSLGAARAEGRGASVTRVAAQAPAR